MSCVCIDWRVCSRFQAILLAKDGGSGWAIGDALTYADVIIYYFTDYVLTLYVQLYQPTSNLQHLIELLLID